MDDANTKLGPYPGSINSHIRREGGKTAIGNLWVYTKVLTDPIILKPSRISRFLEEVNEIITDSIRKNS